MGESGTRFFSDLDLSRRLERAEAHANAMFVDARARAAPASGACWIEVAGAYAMYDGPASPVTQTFGLGLFETPTASVFEELERFFRDYKVLEEKRVEVDTFYDQKRAFEIIAASRAAYDRGEGR